jgi:hypothetical protein
MTVRIASESHAFLRAEARSAPIGSAESLRLMAIGIFAAAASILLIIGPIPFEDISGEVACWITAAVLFGLVLYGWRLSQLRGENSWLSPAYLVMALFCFRYGWGALVAYYWAFVGWEAHPEFRRYFLDGGVWDHLPAACRLILLAGFGFAIGLSLTGPRLSAILPRLTWPVDLTRLRTFVFVFGPAVQIVTWLIGNFDIPKTFAYPFQIVAAMANGLIMLGACYVFQQRGGGRIQWLLFVLVMCGLSLPTALPTGQTAPLLLPFLMMACGYTMVRRKAPWVLAAVAVPAMLYLVLPFTAYYKFAGINITTDRSTVDQRLWAATEAYSRATPTARLEVALSRSLARFNGLPFSGRFVQYFPAAYPFEGGRSFLLEISGLIPRMLWPGKPEVSVELNHYSEKVGLIPVGSTTSVVFDGVSEYYVNFGGAGVFVMSIVNGWYLVALHRWLVREGHYVVGTAIFIPLLLDNWDFFGVVNIASTHIRVLPVWIFAYYVMSRRTV